MSRPTCEHGDFGSDVMLIQECLGCDQDGDFGSQTRDAVESFQATHRLSVDGVVGPDTWGVMHQQFGLPAYPPPPLPLMPLPVFNRIKKIAADSEIARYNWRDRGVAPLGYIQGMAFGYATLYRKLRRDDQPASFLATGRDGRHKSTDALDYLAPQFRELGWNNDLNGPDTLRHLITLLIGLGMRESSGVHCEGRDMSATNTSSDTCEAGLFQTSWNCSNCSTDFQRLMDEYSAMAESDQQTGLALFSHEVSCGSSDWENYGSGTGYQYQQLAKHCPQFAVETTACGLRYLRQHWGPIGRREVEVKRAADEMLLQVQGVIDG